MKRILLSLSLVALAVWALAQSPRPPAGLAAYIPPGPLLVLEAKNFGALVRDWQTSLEEPAWLASDNFQVFSRSRLYLRLADAQQEYATAAGLPPDMNLVDSIAGGESALALYDIGNLQFLYITKLASAKALETVLWHKRSSYETRNAAGTPYFVRIDPTSRKVAAFAASKDYLLLATREDLLAGALTLLAGQPGATVAGERWFSESVRAAARPGDLRLVMNLATLARSPYFRSYWIQRNVSEVRRFNAGIADLHRTPTAFREERVLLRFDQPDASAPAVAAAPDLATLVPPDAGLARAWTRPLASAAVALIQQKLFAPGPGIPPPSQFAPGVVSSGVAGAESDLETRIDEPPLDLSASAAFPDAVRKLIEAAPLEAMLNVGSTRDTPGGVFVNIDNAVVLIAASDWNAAAVQTAFAGVPAAGPLGRVAVEARGRVLIVANTPDLAAKLAAAVRSPLPAAAPGTVYASAFRHSAEHRPFLRMLRLIDHVSTPAMPPGGAREPRFFSDNLGSLSTVLGRVESSSITMRESGPALFETVVYNFGK